MKLNMYNKVIENLMRNDRNGDWDCILEDYSLDGAIEVVKECLTRIIGETEADEREFYQEQLEEIEKIGKIETTKEMGIYERAIAVLMETDRNGNWDAVIYDCNEDLEVAIEECIGSIKTLLESEEEEENWDTYREALEMLEEI